MNRGIRKVVVVSFVFGFVLVGAPHLGQASDMVAQGRRSDIMPEGYQGISRPDPLPVSLTLKHREPAVPVNTPILTFLETSGIQVTVGSDGMATILYQGTTYSPGTFDRRRNLATGTVTDTNGVTQTIRVKLAYDNITRRYQISTITKRRSYQYDGARYTTLERVAYNSKNHSVLTQTRYGSDSPDVIGNSSTTKQIYRKIAGVYMEVERSYTSSGLAPNNYGPDQSLRENVSERLYTVYDSTGKKVKTVGSHYSSLTGRTQTVLGIYSGENSTTYYIYNRGNKTGCFNDRNLDTARAEKIADMKINFYWLPPTYSSNIHYATVYSTRNSAGKFVPYFAWTYESGCMKSAVFIKGNADFLSGETDDFGVPPSQAVLGGAYSVSASGPYGTFHYSEVAPPEPKLIFTSSGASPAEQVVLKGFPVNNIVRLNGIRYRLSIANNQFVLTRV